MICRVRPICVALGLAVMSACAGEAAEPGTAGTTAPSPERPLADAADDPGDDAGEAGAPAGGADGAVEATANDEVWDVVDIVDGDTITVSGPGGTRSVRLIGINTPEVDECLAAEATDSLRQLIGTRQVRLIRDASDTDQFDRLLRYVELDDGTDVGAEQVRAGLAVSRRYEPDTARNDAYDAVQDESRAAGRGQWAPDACGVPMSAGAEIIIDIEYDAPGDDNHNLNAEWVRFTNNGPTLELDGWEIADESASHRYRFDDLTLATGESVTVFTGCGADRDEPPVERYWCNEASAVWNNSGDTVFLRDPSGNNVVTYTYRD